MSSPSSVTGPPGRGSACVASSRRWRAASLRRASTSRRVATVASHARRVARRVLGPDPQRLQQRLLQRVLGGVEVLAPPDQAREHPRDESAQRALVQLSRRLVDHAASVVRGRSHMTSRTSIHSYSGSPPGPGSEET